MADHPKIKIDENGDLWLNFGEYGSVSDDARGLRSEPAVPKN